MKLIRLSSRYATLQTFMTCWCSERVLSRVTPKFLTEGLNLIQVPLVFMNSERCCKLTIHLPVTTRTSVLSSFIWRFLDVVQVLISDTHFSTQRIEDKQSSKSNDFYTCVSSAYNMWDTGCLRITLVRGCARIKRRVLEQSPEVHHNTTQFGQNE